MDESTTKQEKQPKQSISKFPKFTTPQGITTEMAKKAYEKCMMNDGTVKKCTQVAQIVEENTKMAESRKKK